MVGMFRLSGGGAVMFYEIMILVEDEGGVSMKLKHFDPDLRGWETRDSMMTFRLVRASAEAVWFEGLTFRKEADGSLMGFIALHEEDGSVREEVLQYRRVSTR